MPTCTYQAPTPSYSPEIGSHYDYAGGGGPAGDYVIGIGYERAGSRSAVSSVVVTLTNSGPPGTGPILPSIKYWSTSDPVWMSSSVNSDGFTLDETFLLVKPPGASDFIFCGGCSSDCNGDFTPDYGQCGCDVPLGGVPPSIFGSPGLPCWGGPFPASVPCPQVTEVSFANGRDLSVDGYSSDLYSAPHWRLSFPREYPYLITEGTSLLIANAKIQIPGGATGTVLFRGTNVPQAQAQLVSGDVYEINGAAMPPVPGGVTAFYNPLTIDWEVSRDSGASWEPAGQSRNPVYVCLSAGGPTNPFRTVADIACKDGGTTAANVLTRTWEKFSTGAGPANVRTWDDRPLYYYQSGTTFGSNVTPELLLRDGTGQCGSWKLLLRDVWALNGQPSNLKIATVKPGFGDTFWVKNWTQVVVDFYFQSLAFDMLPWPTDGEFGHYDKGSGSRKFQNERTVPGQNSGVKAPSQKVFGNHQFLEVGGIFYDPSYGVTYTSAANFQSTAVQGYGLFSRLSNDHKKAIYTFTAVGATLVIDIT